MSGLILSDFRQEIEALVFFHLNLFRSSSFEEMIRNPAFLHLLRINRIVEIEAEMAYLNYYTEEYSNMKSVKNPHLRNILMQHHNDITNFRNEIYEELIADGSVRGKWISEQNAFSIVQKFYPDARYQYHALWLGHQSLDIYIPSLKTAIEYQGKQHSEAVEFFGGEQGLADNKKRDSRKKNACEQNGVQIVYWNFDEPVTEEYFRETIERQMAQNLV